ncbi:UPF0415 protein C7orf25 homolog isoform X2 [Battus philenor]|uniref:UPF0415 protein C7orf25 homolog isoform X2 n=1 Tax=Battus philenor TaxID=42288 RepID=UPI0035CF0D45
MANTIEEVRKMLEEKIIFGSELITRTKTIDVDGSLKLQRKIQQEIQFLKRLQKSEKIKIEQLACSNLRHLSAMVECASRPGVVSVCKIFHINDENKLLIDVISDEGRTWNKVIARNPKSLSALSSGNASYGARSIVDQAKDYMECAKLYPCMYQPPKVVFEFVSGIEESLANKLKSLGVIVKGEILPNSKYSKDDQCDDSWESSEDEQLEISEEAVIQEVPQCLESQLEIKTLNLDVTAMMAYVSNMTNGHHNYVFKQEVLTQQAAWEAERPVKPILERLFQGKMLVCCRTAWDDFEKIMNTLGGPSEKTRTARLKEMVIIYPDDSGGKKLLFLLQVKTITRDKI